MYLDSKWQVAFFVTLSILLILVLAMVVYSVYRKIYKKSNKDKGRQQEGTLNLEEDKFKHRTSKSSNNSLMTDTADVAQVPTQARATPEREQISSPLIVDRGKHEGDNPDGRGAAKGAALDDAATPLIQYEPDR